MDAGDWCYSIIRLFEWWLSRLTQLHAWYYCYYYCYYDYYYIINIIIIVIIIIVYLFYFDFWLWYIIHFLGHSLIISWLVSWFVRCFRWMRVDSLTVCCCSAMIGYCEWSGCCSTGCCGGFILSHVLWL